MYKPNLDKINKKLKSLGSGKYFKFAEGDNKFRILPPADEKSEFFYEVTQHHGFNDGQRNRAYPCLEAMKARSCPVCTFYRKALEEGEKDVALKVRPSTSYLMNILSRGEDTIKILSMSGAMLKNILTYITDEEYGPEILDDAEGRDFTVTREGSGFNTKYKNTRISPKPRPIGVEGWQEKLHNLSAEVEFKSFDTLVEALDDGYSDYIEEWGLTFEKGKEGKAQKKGDDDGVDEEDEEEPSEKSSGGKAPKPDKARKSAKDEPDEEEGDSEPDSKKSKKGAKSKELAEEADDIEEFLSEDEEDEEIIEEKPKKKKGKK